MLADVDPAPVAAPGTTAALARFAARLSFADLPPEVVAHAKLCILDTLGCGLYGATLPWTGILDRTVGRLAGAGAARVWAADRSVDAATAALVNGSAVHGFELDDLHQPSILHPGSVALSSAAAVADATGGRSGAELITALVAGYEVGSRVGMSLGAAHLLQGFHPTGTHGTLAAAAAAGNLLGLDAERMHEALGIAGSQSAGLMAAQFAAMVKRFHAGRAAQSGVYAALLAAEGYTGIRELFESEYGGYLRTLAPRSAPDKLTAGLGTEWETLTVGFKPYSTNGSCHPAIDALLDLRAEHGFGLDEVAAVRVACSTATKEHVGWAYEPDSVTTAQMNLPYIVAVVLADGDAFVDQFTPERIVDPRLVEASRRVEVVADPAVDARGDLARHATELTVTLHDGRSWSAAREFARGSRRLPLSASEVRAKYDKLAPKAVGHARAAAIADVVADLENRDAEELSALLA